MALFQDQLSVRVGVTCALVASFSFSINDMLIKLMSGGYPLHQIVFVRALVALILTMLIVVPLDGGIQALRTRRPWAHVVRGLCVVVANVTFFTGLAVLPIADATAAFFVAPLLITAGSALFLGESVGPRRWAGVLVGLLGVLIVVQPGRDGFSVWIMLPVLSAAAYAGLNLFTRSMGLTERASTMAVYIQLTFLVVTSLMGLALGHGAYETVFGDVGEFVLRGWVWPSAGDLALMMLTGVMSGAGGLFITLAYRGSDAALVAPFEYAALVLSVIWGVTIFGTFPATAVWAGITLIIASGVYIALREARAGGDDPSAKRASGRR